MDFWNLEFWGNVVGVAAVVLFVFSYQLKKRKHIIICNSASRVLFVIQYCMLGAYTGAIMDVVAFFISLLCCARDKEFIKKHFWLVLLLCNLLIVGAGMSTYKDLTSLLPIFGVIFETLGLWMRKERIVRIVSLLGAPFWLWYNLLAHAYGSAVGNVITLVSLAIAIFRYDILGKQDKSKLNSK